MKKTILFLFVVASVLNNLMAQRNGLVDMGQSKFAKMTNTQLGAVKWTGGFWGERLMCLADTLCRGCGIPGRILM